MWKKTFLLAIAFCCALNVNASQKTVYVSYVLHGNMNYDRYVRPTIWKEFPQIYDNLLTFMDENPDFKGQLQFSGQTLGSLLQCAPQVVDHALAIHKRGQLNFTGTFYSEPVNVNMDGETNFRCAWLGTKIVEDVVGYTDGFYLQERAYHPQLPWILNNSNVSWTPVITGAEDWYPFRLVGMDGSKSVCVPITRHGPELLSRLEIAPKNALLLIEEDYELPQFFPQAYKDVKQFEEEHPGVKVKWITVEEYLKKFGTKGERMVDHAAKAGSRDSGTYSRWTADPLDIIVQDATNRAMADRRSAELVNAFVRNRFGYKADVPFEGSGVLLEHDPLVWNIERADLYPDIEPKYLAREGAVTLLTKAEHLLLWGVNSDAKGWYPLYEKRRERLNSFANSSLLSGEVINRAIDSLAAHMDSPEAGRCYMAVNMENARTKTVALETDSPCEFFDCTDNRPLKYVTRYEKGRYVNEITLELPSFGYTTFYALPSKAALQEDWRAGDSVSCGGLEVRWNGNSVVLVSPEGTVSVGLEGFQLKALADMCDGRGDGEWRNAAPYGPARVSVRGGICPQLRVESQPDWLVHMVQTYTIKDGAVRCDCDFVFPHPVLVRQEGKGTDRDDRFDPRGLVLSLETGMPGKAFYDIPFAICQSPELEKAYLCPLSSCFLQYSAGGGLLVSPQTGEQGFCVEAPKGKVSVYLGASTTSGPIRDVGLEFKSPTFVAHESAWYSEPFHGDYHHSVVLSSFRGDWKDAHVPALISSQSSPVYLREVRPAGGEVPYECSFAAVNSPDISISYASCEDGNLRLRLNEREGMPVKAAISASNGEICVEMPSFAITEVTVR